MGGFCTFTVDLDLDKKKKPEGFCTQSIIINFFRYKLNRDFKNMKYFHVSLSISLKSHHSEKSEYENAFQQEMIPAITIRPLTPPFLLLVCS